jgi:hypothetical protein
MNQITLKFPVSRQGAAPQKRSRPFRVIRAAAKKELGMLFSSEIAGKIVKNRA